MIDPPRDYTVYDMSWVGPAASLISTVADLNRFFGMLLAGEIVDRTSLAQMQRTVPVISFEGKPIETGLGLHRMQVPGGGTAWGHDGSVWGAGAISMVDPDGGRRMSVAINLQRWNMLDSSGSRNAIRSTMRSWRSTGRRWVGGESDVARCPAPRTAPSRCTAPKPARRAAPSGLGRWRRRRRPGSCGRRSGYCGPSGQAPRWVG